MRKVNNDKSLNLVSKRDLVKFDLFQCYLADVGRFKLLSREKEKELAIRFKDHGDRDAAYILVTSNLRLVVKIASRYHRAWRIQHLLDLIQEGNVGLMLAVNKFDPQKNAKLSYYASFWVKTYIIRFIMNNWSIVKIGTTQGQIKLFSRLRKEKQRLIEQGYYPKPELLSERFGVSEREIMDMDQRLEGWDVSLDAPIQDDSDTEKIEFINTTAESVEDRIVKKETNELLHRKVGDFRRRLTKRELEIFDLRIFSDDPVTLQELGSRYGISRQRVRQVEEAIIMKMKKFFKHNHTPPIHAARP